MHPYRCNATAVDTQHIIRINSVQKIYKIVVIIIIVKVVIKLAIIIIWYYLQPSQFKNRFINLHPHDLEDYKKRFFHRKNLKASF